VIEERATIGSEERVRETRTELIAATAANERVTHLAALALLALRDDLFVLEQYPPIHTCPLSLMFAVYVPFT